MKRKHLHFIITSIGLSLIIMALPFMAACEPTTPTTPTTPPTTPTTPPTPPAPPAAKGQISISGPATDVYDSRQVSTLNLRAEPSSEVSVSSAQLSLIDEDNNNALSIETNLADGITGSLNIETVPAGPYIIRADVEYSDGTAETIDRPVTLQGGVPAPVFVSPPDMAQISDDTILEVEQLFATDTWQQVKFSYSVDGITWDAIGVDTDGSDGWSIKWVVKDVPPAGYTLRAVVTDKQDISVETIKTVARIYQSYMMESLPAGPITIRGFAPDGSLTGGEMIKFLNDGSDQVPSLEGDVVVAVDGESLPALPNGMMRLSLAANLINDETQTYMSTVEASLGKDSYIPLRGLPKGTYDLAVDVFYSDAKRSYDLSSPVYRVTATEDSSALLGNLDDHMQLFQYGILDNFGMSNSISIDAHTISGEDVSFHGGWRVDKSTPSPVGFLAPEISSSGGGTFFNVPLTNAGSDTYSDTFVVEYFTWTKEGQPVSLGTDKVSVEVAPGGTSFISLERPEVFGSVDLMGVSIKPSELGVSLSIVGMALRGSDINIISLAGLELGLGSLLFSPVPFSGIMFNMGYSEYHWLYCERVRNTLPTPPPPGATVVWKVVNSDGTTWTSTGRSILKHASIIGGPHRVRVQITSPDGTVTTYGSEHWVHGEQASLVVTTTSSEAVQEKDHPTEFFGPGPGTIGKGQKVKVASTVEVTTTATGTMGNEVTGQVEVSTGVTVGQEIEKETETTVEKPIPDGKCIQLWAVATYHVQKGTWTKTYTDGTVINGTWETKELTGVGTYFEEVPCLK